MTNERKISRPEYIERNDQGKIANIYCKACGVPIAVSRSAHMKRLVNYTEVRMRFADGTQHVTNMCRACVPKIRRSESVMMEIYYADIADMLKVNPALDVLLAGKTKPRIVAVDTSQKGL